MGTGKNAKLHRLRKTAGGPKYSSKENYDLFHDDFRSAIV